MTAGKTLEPCSLLQTLVYKLHVDVIHIAPKWLLRPFTMDKLDDFQVETSHETCTNMYTNFFWFLILDNLVSMLKTILLKERVQSSRGKTLIQNKIFLVTIQKVQRLQHALLKEVFIDCEPDSKQGSNSKMISFQECNSSEP